MSFRRVRRKIQKRNVTKLVTGGELLLAQASPSSQFDAFVSLHIPG